MFSSGACKYRIGRVNLPRVLLVFIDFKKRFVSLLLLRAKVMFINFYRSNRSVRYRLQIDLTRNVIFYEIVKPKSFRSREKVTAMPSFGTK